MKTQKEELQDKIQEVGKKMRKATNGNYKKKYSKEYWELVRKMTSTYGNKGPITKDDFTKIANDKNGNPRYICLYESLHPDTNIAKKLLTRVAAKQYAAKGFEDYFVLETYNLNQSIWKLKL